MLRRSPSGARCATYHPINNQRSLSRYRAQPLVVFGGDSDQAGAPPCAYLLNRFGGTPSSCVRGLCERNPKWSSPRVRRSDFYWLSDNFLLQRKIRPGRGRLHGKQFAKTMEHTPENQPRRRMTTTTAKCGRILRCKNLCKRSLAADLELDVFPPPRTVRTGLAGCPWAAPTIQQWSPRANSP